MSILTTFAADDPILADPILADHLANPTPTVKYTSPDVQNERIRLCAEEVSKCLVNRCQRARYFALLADETTDKSTVTQLCVCIRYSREQK